MKEIQIISMGYNEGFSQIALAIVVVGLVAVGVGAYVYSGHTGLTYDATKTIALDPVASCNLGIITVHVKNTGTSQFNSNLISMSGYESDGTTPLANSGLCDQSPGVTLSPGYNITCSRYLN